MKEQNFKSLAYRPADPLVVLNACRRNLAAIKARELAAALVHAADFYDAQMAAAYPVEVEA